MTSFLSLNAQLEKIRKQASGNSSKDELLKSLEKMILSVEKNGFHSCEEFQKELSKLSDLIINARHEVSEIQPELIRSKHIPAAADELDAVVGATEEATGQILDAVEHIESIAQELESGLKNDLESAASEIYEACSFQDITGQRISKVVQALKEIESTVAGLIESFGGDSLKMETALSNEKKGEEVSLVNGPQLPDLAPTQEEIDKLFDEA